MGTVETRVNLHITFAMHRQRPPSMVGRKWKMGGEEGRRGKGPPNSVTVDARKEQRAFQAGQRRPERSLGARRHAAVGGDLLVQTMHSEGRVLVGANHDLNGPLGGHDEKEMQAHRQKAIEICPRSDVHLGLELQSGDAFTVKKQSFLLGSREWSGQTGETPQNPGHQASESLILRIPAYLASTAQQGPCNRAARRSRIGGFWAHRTVVSVSQWLGHWVTSSEEHDIRILRNEGSRGGGVGRDNPFPNAVNGVTASNQRAGSIDLDVPRGEVILEPDQVWSSSCATHEYEDS